MKFELTEIHRLSITDLKTALDRAQHKAQAEGITDLDLSFTALNWKKETFFEEFFPILLPTIKKLNLSNNMLGLAHKAALGTLLSLLPKSITQVDLSENWLFKQSIEKTSLDFKKLPAHVSELVLSAKDFNNENRLRSLAYALKNTVHVTFLGNDPEVAQTFQRLQEEKASLDTYIKNLKPYFFSGPTQASKVSDISACAAEVQQLTQESLAEVLPSQSSAMVTSP